MKLLVNDINDISLIYLEKYATFKYECFVNFWKFAKILCVELK
jgi:hypothetical protein